MEKTKKNKKKCLWGKKKHKTRQNNKTEKNRIKKLTKNKKNKDINNN